jgi:Protein of unknown function (DUF3373)
MKRIIAMLLTAVVCSLPATAQTAADNQGIQAEIEKLKQSLATLEQKLEDQQKAAAEAAKKAEEPKAAEKQPATDELKADIKDLDERVTKSERRSALDRLNWSGDIRVENNSIFAHVPTHYDGMQMQSLLVKSLWLMSPTSVGGLNLGGPNMAGAPALLGPFLASPTGPAQFAGFLQSTLNGTSGIPNANNAQYQYFTNNLRFSPTPAFPATALGTPSFVTTGLNTLLGAFAAGMPGGNTPGNRNLVLGQFMGFMQQVPGVKVNGYGANANELATNRLRLNFDAHPSDNVDVSARVSMYKVFGDSTGVQVFNGQPSTVNIDGTTARVPTGDYLRVERAYFTWKNIAGLKGNLYLSIGRRPSTDGPPLNYREDEPRGGTPSATLINYQFDGVTIGYHLGEKTTLRACYGLGFDSGFGNGQVLEQPADRVKGVQFLGSNIDLYATDKTFVQLTIARAWNVTDGFNGLTVLPNNPLTGDTIGAPVVLRFSPDANVGNINLYGLVVQRTVGAFDLYASVNWNSLRSNGVSTPFGGLGFNPFDNLNSPKGNQNHEGHMVYAGFRYSVPKDHGRTKIGFEFNQGSKYWFNFAQAEDDIFAPKTSARGEVYESFITHRITNHFIVKGDYQRFHYTYSGSGWDVGAPVRLSSSPILGFPTYDRGTMITAGLQARF